MPDVPQSIVIPGEDAAPLTWPATTSELVISVSPVNGDGEALIALRGDLDTNAAGRIRVALVGTAHTAGCRRIRLDLEHVPFIDSIALRALTAGCATLSAAGVAVVVDKPQPVVQRALEAARLSDPFTAIPLVVAPRTPRV